jgi:hypothetical protein
MPNDKAKSLIRIVNEKNYLTAQQKVNEQIELMEKEGYAVLITNLTPTSVTENLIWRFILLFQLPKAEEPPF